MKILFLLLGFNNCCCLVHYAWLLIYCTRRHIESLVRFQNLKTIKVSVQQRATTIKHAWSTTQPEARYGFTRNIFGLDWVEFVSYIFVYIISDSGIYHSVPDYALSKVNTSNSLHGFAFTGLVLRHRDNQLWTFITNYSIIFCHVINLKKKKKNSRY